MFAQKYSRVQNRICLVLLSLSVWGIDAQSQSCQIIGPVEVCNQSTTHYDLTTENIFPISDVDWNITRGDAQNSTFSGTDVHWTSVGVGNVEAVVTSNGVPYICNVTVQVNPLPSIKGLLSSILSCPDNEINLEVEPCNGCQYLWSVVPGANNPSQVYHLTTAGAQASVTFDDPGTGQICLTIVDEKGCSTSTCRFYGIYDVHPTVQVTGADLQGGEYYVCPHQPVFFGANDFEPTPAYNWHISGNGINVDIPGQDMSFEFPNAGIYTVTLTANWGNCSTSTNYIVHVSDFEPVPIICPSVVCEGQAIEYSVDATCGGTNPIWEVSSQGTISNPTINSTTVTWSTGSSYSVGYIQYNGDCAGYCPAPSIVQVPIFPVHANMNGSNTICSNGNKNYFVPNFPGAIYEWAPLQINGSGSVTGSASSTTPNLFVLSVNNFIGTVTVEVTVRHPLAGCEFTISKVVNIFVGNLNEHEPICTGTSADYTLTPTPPANFNISWQLGSVPLPYHTPTITIPGSYFGEGGLYNVRAVLSTSSPIGSCAISSILNVGDAPAITEVNGEKEVCLNTPYLYSIPISGLTSDDHVYWSFIENGMETGYIGFSVSHTWTSAVNPVIRVWRERTTQFITGDPVTCTSPVTEIPVTALEDVNLTIAGNQAPCPDGEETYTASIVGNYNYHWEVDPALGAVASGQHTPMAHIQWFSAPGPTDAIVRCTVTICDQERIAELPVEITPFQLTLTGNLSPCQDVPAIFSANATSADMYIWYIDDVFADFTTSPDFSHAFFDAGVHRVRVVAVNPNGCAGMPSAQVIVNVLDNPQPAIAILDGGEVSCPVGTPFSLQISVLPEHPSATYNWYLGGAFQDNHTSPYTVTQTGCYTVETTNGVCTNTSEPFCLQYDCGCDCEELPPANDVTVQILSLEYNGDCGAVEFTGSITPFDPVCDRYWIITRPDNSQQVINIDNMADLTQQRVFDQTGLYKVTLRVMEKYNDVIIHAISRENEEYIFQDFCAFESFQDANPTIMFTSITTEIVGEICCPDDDTRYIVIPFQPDFNWSFDCSGDPTNYNVNVADASEIFDDNGLTWMWTVNAGPPMLITDNHFQISGAPPGTVYDVCMKITSSQYNFECTICKTIEVPPAPTAMFDFSATGYCTGQSIQLIPDVDISQVTNVEWDFGDGSTTQIFSPFKSYANAGTYTIRLTVESLYGCIVNFEQQVEIFENSLDGEIKNTPGECPSSATLFFDPDDPSYQYSWSRDNMAPSYTGSPINVMNSGIYRVTVSDANGCSFSPDPFPLVLTDPFPFGIIGDRTACQNVSLRVSNVPGFTFRWDIAPDPNNAFPKNGVAPSFGTLPPGTYSVTVTARVGSLECESLTDEFTVFGSPSPFNILAGPTMCDPYSVLLDADIYDDVVWSSSSTNPTFSNYVSDVYYATLGGTYTATYTDQNGCSVSDNHFVPGGIDFSSFLSGCYKICEGEFESFPPIQGIPGVFDSWYWEVLDADGVTVHYAPDPPPGVNSVITPLPLKPSFRKITLHVTLNGCSAVSDTLCIEPMNCCPANLTATAYLGLDGSGCMLRADGETVHHIVGHIDWPPGWHYCGNPPTVMMNGGFFIFTSGPYSLGPNSIGLEGFMHVTNMVDYQNGVLMGTIDLCNDVTGEICPAKFNIPFEMCPESIWCMSDMETTIDYTDPNPHNWTATLTFSFPGHYTTGTPCAVNNYYGFLRDATNTQPLTFYYPFPGGPPPFQMNSFDYVITYAQYLQGGCVTLNYLSNCGHWCQTLYCYGENPPRPGERDNTSAALLPNFALNPNPASNTVQVVFNSAGSGGNAYLNICNSLGQNLLSMPLGDTESVLSLDVSDWKPGVYQATLQIDGRPVETLKLVIQH